jgi:hypothetical protein
MVQPSPVPVNPMVPTLSWVSKRPFLSSDFKDSVIRPNPINKTSKQGNNGLFSLWCRKDWGKFQQTRAVSLLRITNHPALPPNNMIQNSNVLLQLRNFPL